jgi:hypothetical protein
LKAKTYMMPRSFVCDVLLLVEHIRAHYKLDPDAIKLLRAIEAEIDAKIDSLRKRDAFSQYKSAPYGSDGREKHRNEYLDLAHIHKKWRSQDETSV